jgi:hypothetical protein
MQMGDLKDAPYGIPLRRKKDGSTIMRLKPTGFLLNSTLVVDALNHEKCFISNLSTGTMFVIEGSEQVTTLEYVFDLI